MDFCELGDALESKRRHNVFILFAIVLCGFLYMYALVVLGCILLQFGIYNLDVLFRVIFYLSDSF